MFHSRAEMAMTAGPKFRPFYARASRRWRSRPIGTALVMAALGSFAAVPALAQDRQARDAADAPLAAAQAQAERQLQQTFTNLRFEDFGPSPVKGPIYQASAGGRIVYYAPESEQLLFATVYDRNGVNLTALAQEQGASRRLKAIDPAKALAITVHRDLTAAPERGMVALSVIKVDAEDEMGGERFSRAALPDDWQAGRFVGRVAGSEGPIPILVDGGCVQDMSALAPTISMLVDRLPIDARGPEMAPLDTLRLLSPIDLQCVKASGVTFAVSALERVIEERARGDADAASAVRGKLEARIGGSIRSVVPGSTEASALKAALIDDGMWSQYLEVAIGPDAEIFTKSPVLSTIGWGDEIGVRSDSSWNNPEPEVVLLVDSHGTPVGATLGNDVNLRDFEGRSALLLGKAKDNNASCAIGPLVRLFDDGFTMDDVRNAQVDLLIEGAEGYRLTGRSSMDQISRDPEELVRQALSEHQYPDGFALFLGTLFAPTDDRDEPGRGFTHRVGDVVTISSARLGTLVNTVTTSKAAAPWTGGIGALIRNLARRGLLTGATA